MIKARETPPDRERVLFYVCEIGHRLKLLIIFTAVTLKGNHQDH